MARGDIGERLVAELERRARSPAPWVVVELDVEHVVDRQRADEPLEAGARRQIGFQRQLRGEALLDLLLRGRRTGLEIDDAQRGRSRQLDAIGLAAQAEFAAIGEREARGREEFDADAADIAAPVLLPADEMAGGQQEARPPEGLDLRHVVIGAEEQGADADELPERIGRQPFGVGRGEFLDDAVQQLAAILRRRIRHEIVERVELQDLAGMDLVGVAIERLDLGDAERKRLKIARRARRRAADGLHIRRGAQHTGQGPQLRPFLDGLRPDRLRRHHLQALPEAGRDGFGLSGLARTRQRHLRRKRRHDEIMRGLADTPLGRRETELCPHRPVDEGIGRGLRRPDHLVQAAEHDMVGLQQARFEQTPDRDARVARGGALDHGLRQQAVEDGDEIARRAARRHHRLGACKLVEKPGERFAIRPDEGERRAVLVQAEGGYRRARRRDHRSQ